MATDITNPYVYTKNSFEYYFVWDWVSGATIDLTQEYEILIYARDSENNLQVCNQDFPLIVTYNQPVSALYIEQICANSEFLIPENCFCQFKIRKKEIEPDSWDDKTMFPSSDFSLMPVPCRCNVLANDINDNFVFSVGGELKDYINSTTNKISKYFITPTTNNRSFDFPSLNCYIQNSPFATQFQFNLYYNSGLKLGTEYIAPIYYYRKQNITHNFNDPQKIEPLIAQVVDRFEINLSKGSEIYEHNLPNENGALVYIKNGDGWKINQTTISHGNTYSFSNCGVLSFDSSSAITDLKGYFFTAPFEQTNDLERNITITTGTKYAQQIEAFDDLKTIKPISDISNNEFTYQYDSINEHTPVFIYQKMIDNTYNLTNNLSNLNTGVLNTDFENISKNDLIVTTSPVMNYKYGAVSLNGNTYTHINVQDYKNFIISTIKIGSGIPSDHTSGYIQIAYDDDFSFENAQIVNNNDVINVENYNYVNIKFVRDIGSGSSIIKYFLEEEGEQSLKTSDITTEEIGEYIEEHAYMLNVNKVFNSLEEEFIWQSFNITQETGQPKLIINAQKNNFSNLYTYKILIQNQMSNREIINQELDFKYSNATHLWRIYKNNMSYPDGYVLSDLVHNELSSKEKYHIIIKRIYNGDEYIIDERDVDYENNTDFFLAPSNNINYNPGEEIDFYFSTERNNSENAAQGYPWLIYNNKDNASYFCYSNQAYNNNADNRGIDNYDSNKSDNKQLIHINYHDKPNFTPKEVIPMLDFKITELVETNSNIINPSFIFNQTNIILAPNSNGVNVQTNGENASFTFSTSFIDNDYLSFYGGSIVGMGQIEILDNDTEQILFSTANSGSCFVLTNLWNGKYVNNNTGLSFNFKSNGYINFYNTYIQTLKKPETDTLLNKRKFYIDNFSVNEIDYSEIENGSVITGQVLELHKPVTLHIKDFTTNMSSNNSIYYKIEKVNEYNQDVITPIDDDNSITILQKNRNGNEFTKDFYINSYTNQLKIQNTKTKKITFNNAQKDTMINCVLEKEEEVED